MSHDHYDHLCMPTLQRIFERDRPAVYTGLGNEEVLLNGGITEVVELDWWQSAPYGGVEIMFVPAQHASARSLLTPYTTLWGGFVVRGTKHRAYFAGDTAHGAHFAEIGERCGPIDLALLPIAAYRPQWFMKAIHMSPFDAVEAHRQLEAHRSLAIHFGTFPLADDGQWEPLGDLDKALSAAGLTRDESWVL